MSKGTHRLVCLVRNGYTSRGENECLEIWSFATVKADSLWTEILISLKHRQLYGSVIHTTVVK